MVEKMLKAKRSSSGEDTTNLTRDGESSILIPRREEEPRVATPTSVSTSTDHSTSDQDFQ
jgi:hypothetical protein